MIQMDPNQETENIYELVDEVDARETGSVDDFIKELEEKEKDLHITADTTIIEIAQSFDDSSDMPEFLREEVGTRSIEPARVTPELETFAAQPFAVRPASPEHAVEGLRDRLAQMEAEREELFATAQRRTRDFENFKSRAERERKETFQSQVGNLATQMLPALDNLDRALDFAETLENKTSEFKQFFDGIVLVNEQVMEVFERMGVSPIPTVGHAFDPHLHEAVATEVNNDLPPNTISEELLRGYRMGDKVIRHSLVKVSKRSSDQPPETVEKAPILDIG